MRRLLLPLICILLTVISCSQPAVESVFYVAPDGDDSNTGSMKSPFATITRARDAARDDQSGLPKKIVMRGGEYYEVAVTLGPEDAGLAIEAAAGEKPVLYGGQVITGWERDGDFMAVELDGVKEGTWDFRSLVVDDELRLRSRLPEDGAYRHESEFKVRWMSTAGNGWQRKPTEEELTTMIYKEGDLGPWLDIKNAELTIFHAWDESVVGLSGIDLETRTVKFSNPSGHPPGAFGDWLEKAYTYVVWNVREGMTQPGQWYLDRTGGKVVYWPLPGEDMSSVTTVVPTTDRIFSLKEGADGITLGGLTLSCTTTPLVKGGFAAARFDGAITLEGCDNCLFTDLTIKAVGGWAVKPRGDNITIEHCEINDIGAGGIGSNGDNIVATDCHIHDIGKIYPSAIAVYGGGDNILISHNEIHDTPYSAVSFHGDNSLIESNLFYDTMQVLSDGAAIYITSCDNTVIRGNVVRGSRGAGPAHAYYMDEKSFNCIVENNLAVHTAWPSHNHMARDSIIRNNVFIDHGEQLLTFPRSSGMIFEKNILIADKIAIQAHTKVSMTPENMEDVPEVVIPFVQKEGILSMANNILHSLSGKIDFVERWEHKDVKTYPLEPRDGTLFADPMIADWENGDFTFQAGSPAEGLGILPIDVSSAGRLK